MTKKLVKWLYPGMGVKRWLGLLVLGVTLMALALGYVLVSLYREQPLPAIFYYLTLQFLPRLGRAALFAVLGIAIIAIALFQLSRSLLTAAVPSAREDLTDVVFRRRVRGRGPRIVAIGGGTGLSTLLRGLKEFSP